MHLELLHLVPLLEVHQHRLVVELVQQIHLVQEVVLAEVLRHQVQELQLLAVAFEDLCQVVAFDQSWECFDELSKVEVPSSFQSGFLQSTDPKGSAGWRCHPRSSPQVHHVEVVQL